MENTNYTGQKVKFLTCLTSECLEFLCPYSMLQLCLTDTPETRSCYSLISAQVHVHTSVVLVQRSEFILVLVFNWLKITTFI